MDFNSLSCSNINLDQNISNIKNYLNNNMTNLTSLLKKEDMQIILNELVNYPEYNKEILLKRDRNILGFESHIGMSYDYALRFLLSYQEKKSIDNALYDSIGFNMEKNKKKLINDYKSFEQTNKLLGIVDLSFKLSLNEMLFRNGIKKDISEFSKDKLDSIYQETIKLLKLSFNEIQKHKISKIEYNPVFAYGNILADGDILINNTLVDFKAVSSLNNFKDHINQLIMYSILNEYNDNHKIDNIQMYYPRYNDFPIFKIDDLINKKDRNLIKKMIYFNYSNKSYN